MLKLDYDLVSLIWTQHVLRCSSVIGRYSCELPILAAIFISIKVSGRNCIFEFDVACITADMPGSIMDSIPGIQWSVCVYTDVLECCPIHPWGFAFVLSAYGKFHSLVMVEVNNFHYYKTIHFVSTIFLLLCYLKICAYYKTHVLLLMNAFLL